MDRFPPPGVARELESALVAEVSLHEKYLEVLERERAGLVAFDEAPFLECVALRDALCRKMEAAADARRRVLARLPGSGDVRLRDFVRTGFAPADAARLRPVVERLRKLAAEASSAGREHKMNVDFSLRLVAGTLSILWSGRQNVSRVYDRGGEVRERYHPRAGRVASSLKRV